MKWNQNTQNFPEPVEQTLDRTEPELTEPPGVHRANAELNGTRTNSTFQISWNKLQKLNRTRTNRTFQSPQSKFIIKWNQNSLGGSELTEPSGVHHASFWRQAWRRGSLTALCWTTLAILKAGLLRSLFCRGDCWRHTVLCDWAHWLTVAGGGAKSTSSPWTTWTTSRTLTSPGSC